MEEWGALGYSAYILGLLEKVLVYSVEHAKQREQFGKPLGSFQAIQCIFSRVGPGQVMEIQMDMLQKKPFSCLKSPHFGHR